MLCASRTWLPRAAPRPFARPLLRCGAVREGTSAHAEPSKQRRSGTVININHVHNLVVGPADKGAAAADWGAVPVNAEVKALLQQHGVKAGTARRLHESLGFEDVSDVLRLTPALLSDLALKPLELAPLMALVAQQAQQQGGSAKAEAKGAEPAPQLQLTEVKTCEADVESLQRRVGLLEERLQRQFTLLEESSQRRVELLEEKLQRNIVLLDEKLQRKAELLEEELQEVKTAIKRLDHPLAKRLQEGELFHQSVGSVAAVAITPDARRVVCGNTIGDLCIYDLESFDKTAHLCGPAAHSITSVAITPDGRRAVSAGLDMELRVWDLEKRTSIATLKGHTGCVWAVAVTPDGQRAVSGSSDGTLRVWGLSDFSCLAKLSSGNDSGRVDSVACTPDGRHVVSAGKDATLRKWSLDTYECVAASADDDNHDDEVQAVAISSDGRLVVTGSDDSSLGVWSLESLTRTATLELDSELGTVTAVAVTPDRRYALCGGGSDCDDYDDWSLHLWDLQTCTQVAALEGHTADVASVAISPDGRLVVSSCTNGDVRVWDLQGRLAHLQATAAPESQVQVPAQQQAQATAP